MRRGDLQLSSGARAIVKQVRALLSSRPFRTLLAVPEEAMSQLAKARLPKLVELREHNDFLENSGTRLDIRNLVVVAPWLDADRDEQMARAHAVDDPRPWPVPPIIAAVAWQNREGVMKRIQGRVYGDLPRTAATDLETVFLTDEPLDLDGQRVGQ